MITQASISVAADGGVLVTLPRTGMDLAAETLVSLRDGKLVVGQGRTAFVSVAVADAITASAIAATTDISVVEADEAGFDFHSRVRKV